MRADLNDQQPADLPDVGAQLSYERTYLAHERTQLAWVRTALTLITFGFTLTKFFEYLREKQGQHATVLSPRAVGILMISIGLVTLVTATLCHYRAVLKLRARCPGLPISPAAPMAWLMGALGIMALLSAVFHH